MFPPTDAWRRRRRRLAAGASAASGIEASVGRGVVRDDGLGAGPRGAGEKGQGEE